MSLLESIGAHCWLNSINEVEINNFKAALAHFKKTEKYAELLERYDFDESNNSTVFCDELANLILEEKAIYSKNSNTVFFTFSLQQVNELHNHIDKETSGLINSLLSDNRKYNTDNGSKVKKKSLI